MNCAFCNKEPVWVVGCLATTIAVEVCSEHIFKALSVRDTNFVDKIDKDQILVQ